MKIGLEEIKNRLAKTTPGKWVKDERVGCVSVYSNQEINCIDELKTTDRIYYQNGHTVKDEKGNFKYWEVAQQHIDDANFIANAKQDIQYLLKFIGGNNMKRLCTVHEMNINSDQSFAKGFMVGLLTMAVFAW